MKKRMLIFAALVLLLSFGCAPPQSGDQQTGGLTITLPGGSQNQGLLMAVTPGDVDRYVIQLISEENSYSSTFTGTPGETIEVEGLLPGTYSIQIDAHDDDLAPAETLIYTGSSTTSVAAGVDTSVVIQLDYATGGIIIGIEFPDGPITPVHEVYTGWVNGSDTYSTRRLFNEDGMLVSIVSYSKEADETEWDAVLSEVFAIDGVTGLRTGSVKTDAEGDVIATGTVKVNADGIETGIVYDLTDMPPYMNLPAEISVDLNSSGMGYLRYEMLDSEGNVIRTESWNDDGTWLSWGWTDISVDVIEDDEGGVISRTVTAGDFYEYFYENYPGTGMRSTEEVYINDVLDNYSQFYLRQDGLYESKQTYAADGTLSGYIIYGAPVVIDNYYVQNASRYNGSGTLQEEFTQFTSAGLNAAGDSLSAKGIFLEGSEAGGQIVAW